MDIFDDIFGDIFGTVFEYDSSFGPVWVITFEGYERLEADLIVSVTSADLIVPVTSGDLIEVDI